MDSYLKKTFANYGSIVTIDQKITSYEKEGTVSHVKDIHFGVIYSLNEFDTLLLNPEGCWM